jgi:hypothetical protein
LSADYDTHYEAMKSRNFFQEMLDLRDRQRAAKATASPIIEGDKIPWEDDPMGLTRWYMAPTMTDLIDSTMMIHSLKIPAGSHSGKQLVQGDTVGFIWKGEQGYTMVDNVRHEWENSDVVQIPSRFEGCVIQHFNTGESDVEIIFAQVNTAYGCGVDRGSGFEQLESHPGYGSADASGQ